MLGGLWFAEQSGGLKVRHQPASHGKAIREVHQRDNQHGFKQRRLVPTRGEHRVDIGLANV